jgi:tetratricopeptide (TPR) repeat protein
MEKVGKTGYQAAFAAAVKIIDDFNARPPKELYSLVDIKSLATLKNRKNISNFDLFQKYYEKGQYQYEKKNYYQALYSFEKAEQINPDDLSTAFYIGVCCTYTAQKEKALQKFKEVVEQDPKSQEAVDAKKWLEILREPLKIGILISDKSGNFKSGNIGLKDSVIQQSLADSKMYELSDINDINYPGSVKSAEFKQFLDNNFKKGVKIIINAVVDQSSKRIEMANKTVGDIATEHVVKITANAYSTKKKTLQTEIMITERASTIRGITKEEEMTIKQQLLDKGAEKLVLRLLENNIF